MRYLIDVSNLNPFDVGRYREVEITDMKQFEDTLRLFGMEIANMESEQGDVQIITIGSLSRYGTHYMERGVRNENN